jgi:hypothetical protein
MSISPLGPIVEAMFEGAKSLWPDLTREQFTEAGNALFEEQPSQEGWSIREVNDGLMSELTKRYGPPVR